MDGWIDRSVSTWMERKVYRDSRDVFAYARSTVPLIPCPLRWFFSLVDFGEGFSKNENQFFFISVSFKSFIFLKQINN